MKSKRRIWILAGILLVLLIALPFPVGQKLEENDAFCISCHTAPEETYYGRAQDSLAGTFEFPPDLASAHYTLAKTEFRCIDCHRGDQSLNHRFRTFLLGAQDALIWASGKADPTLEKIVAGESGLLNAGCVSCHTESLLELGFNNHFHNQLSAAGALEDQGLAPYEPEGGLQGTLFMELAEVETGITCLDCHQGHNTIPDGDLTLYIDVQGFMYPSCVRCHEEAGRGPLILQ